MASPRSPKDVDKGLKALVLNAGSATRAAKDTGIPRETLVDWRRKTYRERYEALRQSHEQTVDKELGEDMLRAARDRLQASDEVLVQLKTAIKNRDWPAVKALSAADKNLFVGAGISNQHSRMIREKPTEVRRLDVDVTRVDRAIRALEEEASRLPAIDVESRELPPGVAQESLNNEKDPAEAGS